MSVVTISRGSFSGGKLIAEKLADSLGYRCVDRDVIVERASKYGVSQEELRNALDKPPSFIERLQHKKYLYLTLIQAGLASEVQEGKAVYHGNAGHLLLEGGGPVLRVRIIAPLETRIDMARERLSIKRSAAIAHIRKMDEQRQRWTHYLYGVDWRDPSLYDLVLNLDHITIDDATGLIDHLVRKQGCFDYSGPCRDAMNNVVLAATVKAELALNPATRHLEFEVRSKAGLVFLTGRMPSVDLEDEVRRVALSVDGVRDLNLDGITMPIQS